MRMYRKGLLTGCLLIVCLMSKSQLNWPRVTKEAQPWTRWWWLGNAVDSANLSYSLQQFRQAGIGGVEITPIYGTKGFEKQFINFLSPRWMHMLGYTISEGKRLGITVDMNTGTGWPFGGPGIPLKDASGKVYFREFSLQGGESAKETVR